MPLFDTHIIVDWSARSKPSKERPTKDAIWWAATQTVDRVETREPEYLRTRHEAICRLACLLAAEVRSGRRVLIGFDFPFGYPAGIAEKLTGKPCALALWDWLAKKIEDGPDNSNNRFKVATAINRRCPGCGPFWGRPPTLNCKAVPVKKSERTGRQTHPPEKRICDDQAAAKTVWQLAYAGSVGSQTLLGLPAVKRLTEDCRIARHSVVWPFQTGLRVPDARVAIVEVYPSLLREEVRKRCGNGEIHDSAQVRVNAEAFARLDAKGKLCPLFKAASNLKACERRRVKTEEGWIFGLDHEEALRDALRA